jgi:two-component system, chemotaxis family, chemotaxis protein CheY
VDRSILIVDDDAFILEALAELLRDEGYEVRTATNGREALEALAQSCARVILLDLMMPIMDGYGFLEQRRLDPALVAIPVAIVTAGHGIDHHRIGDGLQVIRKPFDVARLLGILNALGSGAGAST